METKECTKCKKDKPLSDFRVQKKKNYIMSSCKRCEAEYLSRRRKLTGNAITKTYEKTKKGFIVRLYRNMKSRIEGVQKAKHHLYKGKYLLPKEEFYEFMLNNSNFHKLFETYEESGYERKLAPSVDRINSARGYHLDNIRVVTMSENSGHVRRNIIEY